MTRLSNDQIFEIAFLPRVMFEISKQAITEGQHVTDAFKADYREAMELCRNKTQRWDVERDICNVSNGVFDLLADKKTGALLTTKTSMVVFGLCILAAQQKDGMFTDRFEAALNEFNDELRKTGAGEMAAVERSAQKKLVQVIGYLHSRFKFKWLSMEV